jgi:hypothetical protein
MSLRGSLDGFVAKPRASAALALLCVVIGVVCVSGLVPLSPNRSYFPGHQWVLALLSWLLALLFAGCAAKGFKKLRSRPTRG